MKEYPSKVILAWSEAMRDNEAITDWLLNNGYPELVSCIASFKGNTTADKWLMKKGHPELVAFVDYINGKDNAGQWLTEHGYDLLHIVADHVLEDETALNRLAVLNAKEFIVLAQRLKSMVEDIDFDTNDVHKSPFR